MLPPFASKPPSAPVFLATAMAATQLGLGFVPSSKLSSPGSNCLAMDVWPCFDVTHSWMEGLVKKGLLHARTATNK
jgi:hypothetical protein